MFTPIPILSLLSLLLLSLAPSYTIGDMIPSSPDGSSSYDIGSTITALWTEDSTGQWTDVTLKLMSGDNFQMVEVVTIATGINATSTSSYAFAAPWGTFPLPKLRARIRKLISSLPFPSKTAPDVTPNSKIYFLQFTPAGNASAYEWTTRFTIAAADGSTTAPANSTQPDGEAIPWGVGTLVGSYATNSTTGSGSSSSSSSNSTASASTPLVILTSNTATATGAVATTTAASMTTSSMSMSMSATSSGTDSSATETGSASTATASSTSAKSGAGRNGVMGLAAGLISVGLGLVAVVLL